MLKSTSIHLPFKHILVFLRGSFSLLAMVCIALMATLGNIGISYADGVPGGKIQDPVVRAVDIAKPAVVRIITTINGRLTVQFNPTPDRVTFPLGGGSYKLELSGSGAFISSHGDILTADHVVNPPHDQSLDQVLYYYAADDIAQYINQHYNVSQPVTKNDVIYYLESDTFTSKTAYDKASSEVYLSTDYTGSILGTNLKDVPAALHATVDRIEQESTFDKKDVAIVHINMTDTPSIKLDDSSNVEQQDELTIIGFPGRGDVSDAPSYFLTSSINRLFVSSIKKSDNGAPLIQVGGNIEHGDSGGPALDSQGNIVGIVSFGLETSDTSGGTAFLQASSSALELVNSLKLDTTPGNFQQSWLQAFKDYTSLTVGHWHKALQDFEKIAENYPLFNAIRPYLTYTESKASTEVLPKPQPKTQPPPDYTWLIVGVMLIILAIAVFIVLLLFSRRGGKQAAVTTSTERTAEASLVSSPWDMPVPVNTPAHPLSDNLSHTPIEVDAVNVFNATLVSEDTTTPEMLPVPIVSLSGSGQFASPVVRMPSSLTEENTAPQPTVVLNVWPCGHKNPSSAIFCAICGTPATISSAN